MMNLTKIKQFWDNRAAKGIKSSSSTNLEDNIILREKKEVIEWEKIRSALISPLDVLDLGCGNGYWAFKLAPYVHTVVGIDQCQEFINQAKERKQKEGILNAFFYCKPVQDIDCSFYKFDIIFLSGIVIYLNDEEFNKVLDKMKALSHKNTAVIMRETTSLKDRKVLDDVYSTALNLKYCATYRTEQEYAKMFAERGFYLSYSEDMFSKESGLNKHPDTRLRLFRFERV